MAETGRRLKKADWKSLEMAFESDAEGARWYLDVETGETFFVETDLARDVERAAALLSKRSPAPSGEGLVAAIADFLRPAEDGPDWERDDVERAARVHVLRESRYVEVPHKSSHEGWRDMAAFTDSLEDDRLARRLADAIRGKGAFGRFKRELSYESEALDRWYEFKRERARGRIRAWLEAEGFEIG